MSPQMVDLRLGQFYVKSILGRALLLFHDALFPNSWRQHVHGLTHHKQNPQNQLKKYLFSKLNYEQQKPLPMLNQFPHLNMFPMGVLKIVD